MAQARARESLADILLRRFPLDEKVVREARDAAEACGSRLDVVLVERGLVSDARMALAMGEYLSLPSVSLARFKPDDDLIYAVPPRVLTELRVLPLARWEGFVAIATADPFDAMGLDEAADLLEAGVITYVAPKDELELILGRCRTEPLRRLEDVLRDVRESSTEIQILPDEDTFDVGDVFDAAEDVPVVRIVNSMLIEALHRGASDIHVEPREDGLQVRYRIDGVLYEEPSPPKYMQWAILSRIKIVSNLDIAERRLPQDGRFTIHAPGRDVDVRVSLIPTVHGQKAVLRILDQSNLKPNLAALGLEQNDYEKLEKAIRQPSGLILVTGPTGCGKTTTLYSALQELNQPGVNIITVEDPVEYQLHRINQIPVNAEIGLTFAAGLRSILRQDPDIIMVGEIRDKETAGIAVQAALTGHMVLSTLHTNDASGAVARLIHMGVEAFLISSALIMAQAQRIYRKLCRACKRRREVPWDVLQLHGIDVDVLKDGRLYAPTGCLHCGQIGYAGRDAVMEILEIDDGIRELILREATAAHIRDAAVAKGMRTLRGAGLQRVCKGITSIEEILRVTSS
jgi:type IV pilus assembly protein PilB